MAANDLTTVTNLKLWLGVTQNTDDAQLGRLVTAASTFVQEFVCRDIVQQTYTERYHGGGTSSLVLRNWPLISIASIGVGAIVVPNNSLTFDDRTIYLADGYVFTKGKANIVVAYSAGYTAGQIPPSLEQACIELAAIKYRSRDRIGHQSKQLAGEVVTFSVDDLPPSTKRAIELFTNRVPA